MMNMQPPMSGGPQPPQGGPPPMQPFGVAPGPQQMPAMGMPMPAAAAMPQAPVVSSQDAARMQKLASILRGAARPL